MTSTTWPGAVDTFPSAATLETSGRTLANLDGLGLEHSDWMERVGQAIRAVETTLDTQVPNATGNSVTDNNLIAVAVADCISNGTRRLVFGYGEYNLTTAFPALPTGGSFSAGTVKGIRFSGRGEGLTILKYTPSGAFSLFTAGGNVSQAAGHFGWDHLTIKLGNSTAVSGINLKDPCNYCVIENVEFLGVGAGNGMGVLVNGQTVASTGHTIRNCTFYGFSDGIRFSGFGNSNTVEDCWFGQCTYGIHSEALAPDTQGGQTNSVKGRCEFNGGTATAIALRGNSLLWDLDGVNCDGPTKSVECTTGSDYNTFTGCNLPVVDLQGTTLETTVFIGGRWSTNGIVDARAEIRVGNSRMFYHQGNNELVFGDNSNDGAGSVPLTVQGELRFWDAIRFRDTSNVTQWHFRLGSVSANSFDIFRQGAASASLYGNASGHLSLGMATGQVGFFGALGTTKPTVTGSRGGNAALADLLTKLAALNLLVDSSS